MVVAEFFSGLGVNQNMLWIVIGIAVILYVYLWFYNTEAALNITYGVGRVLYEAVIGIARLLIVIVTAIGRGIYSLFQRLFK